MFIFFHNNVLSQTKTLKWNRHVSERQRFPIPQNYFIMSVYSHDWNYIFLKQIGIFRSFCNQLFMLWLACCFWTVTKSTNTKAWILLLKKSLREIVIVLSGQFLMCVCKCVCVYMCVHVCGGQKSASVSSSMAFHLFFGCFVLIFRQDLSLSLELIDSGILASQKSPGVALTLPPSTGITGVKYHTWVFFGC